MAMQTFRVSPKVERFFYKRLALLIYHHIVGNDYRRYFDSFRGSLDVCFHLDLLSLDAYIFFVDFLCWLDDKYLAEYGGERGEMCRIFYDGILEKLDVYLNY